MVALLKRRIELLITVSRSLDIVSSPDNPAALVTDADAADGAIGLASALAK